MSQFGVNFNYTYNGKLLTEVMFKPSIDTPALDTFARIVPGQKFKLQIPRINTVEKLWKSYDTCTRTVTGDGISFLNTTIELKPIELYLPQCKDDLEGAIGNILAEEWLRSGVDEANIEGTRFQSIINQLLEDGTRRDVFRIFSFADTNDADSNYNQIDGLWPTLIANSGNGSSYCVRRTTSIGMGDLTSGEALAILEQAYVDSAIILKQMPNSMKKFDVTGTVYENLLKSYEANVNGTERQFTMLTNGVDGLNYRGIPVRPIYAWDNALLDPANPLFGTAEHLVLYTTRDNHYLAVDNSADLNRITGWYEKKDRQYNFEGFMRLGYNYLHCDLQSIAY